VRDLLHRKPSSAPLLRIGRSDDGHEREADHFAKGAAHGVRRGTASAQRSIGIAPPIVGDVLRSSGRPLDDGTRALMDARFDHDFSAVRVHDDAHAAAAASAVRAQAFTVGNQVVFGRSQYRPGTQAGNELLQHELVHTLQQSAGGEPVVQRKTVCDDEGFCRCEPDDEEIESSNAGQCSVESDPPPAPAVPGRIPSGGMTPLRPTPSPFPLMAAGAAPLLRPPLPLPAPPAPAPPFLRLIPGGGGAPAPVRAPPRVLPISPLGAGILAGAVILLTPSDLAPPWMDELNPYTGAPYKGPDEYRDVQRRRAEERRGGPAQDPQQGPQQAPQPQPQPKPRNPEQECRELYPYALTCDPGTMDREAVAQRFLQREGVNGARLSCSSVASFGVGDIDACDGAPGERAHCVVNGNKNRIVSLFGCLCCGLDGSTGYSWRGAHWSVNLSRRGGR